MSSPQMGEWGPVLLRLNSIMLRVERWRNLITEESQTAGWCGSPPASENEIERTEKRLGVRLPPSYRAFLLISNGWRPFSNFIERLVPAEEVEEYRVADPDDLALIQQCYQEDDISDQDYLDYKTPEHLTALRHRYYPQSLLIGRKWDGGGGELLLLNPHVISSEGEWETIFFANWLPGNERYPSFRDFVDESVNTLERIEAARPT